ncbi:low molecular weight protein-tyrosine-phosphatase [Phytohalomonas tamaricis]|uniref:low molecular weight protein-tyrosine-phosphatase n=1 Tax=Phytohalomonas tamaricis TaxID=2081032 RepID=UPI0021D47E58|nr:low molecular weight protein-tyrosine-phosphatase [Phytohalomonas tamaricis]
MIKVLFVCLGNICRSPTAEGVFHAKLASAGLTHVVSVDSCGTGHWHVGKPPDERACNEAMMRGLSIDTLRARQLEDSDLMTFDYILAMDQDNLDVLMSRRPADCQAHIGLLLDFAETPAVREVPDPYYGGREGFAYAYELIESASDGLIAHLRTRHEV